MELLEELDDRYGLAYTLDSLGYAHVHLGEHAEAVAWITGRVDLQATAAALLFWNAAEVYVAQGKLLRAVVAWLAFFLATPGDLAGRTKTQPGFLFRRVRQRFSKLKSPQLLTLSAFIFNDSDLWSMVTVNAVATRGG